MTEAEKLTLKEQLTKIIKDTCHFAAEEGQCSISHKCDLTNCKYANEQSAKILALGLVQLDEDQSLPENLFDSPARSKSFYDYCNAKRSAFVLGQESLINAGFRKVKGQNDKERSTRERELEC